MLCFYQCGDLSRTGSDSLFPKDNRVFLNGELRAVCENNSASYFVFRGAPMGYHYELLQNFAQKHQLKLKVLACKTPDEALQLLNEGKCDVIAMNLSMTRNHNGQILFTKPLRESSQVLIQRKPEQWRAMNSSEIESLLIRQPLQLAKKTVTVPKGSSYALRLRNIIQEIGDTIYIHEVDKTEEELFDAVANGDCQYTVCDEYDALLNRKYFPNIDAKTFISFKQNIAWAVVPYATDLCDSVNLFLQDFLGTSEAITLFNKYYRYPIACRMAQATQHSQGAGCITFWDKTLQKAGDKYHIDWMLIASLMYQESRFDTEAHGQKGAFGLMQIMPETMEEFNIDSLSLPEEQIMSGVCYLSQLNKQFIPSVPDSAERIKFAIAAYNVGAGHIFDAQRLTQKTGGNPALWSHVAPKLLEKVKPEIYYPSDDVRHGYCNGVITINYVQDIFERYEHYRAIFSNQ
jgi:membrane-bound lytic murein transglycosylase F